MKRKTEKPHQQKLQIKQNGTFICKHTQKRMFFDSKQEEKMIYISLVLCLFLLELSGCNTPAGKAWTPVPSTENGEFVAKLKTTKKQKRGGSS
jgi:hypothetical protein